MRRKSSWEQGAIKKRWTGKISIALLFPNVYAVGMSNLGMQVLYGLLNSYEQIVAERFFVPESKDISTEWRSIESNNLLSAFDFILSSISFETDYVNIVRALASAGIPLRAESRDKSDVFVFGGGVATIINPEPIAPFLDAVFLGEAECMMPELVKILPALLDSKTTRQTRLEYLLDHVPGTYITNAYFPQFNSKKGFEGFETADSYPMPVVPAKSAILSGTVPHSQIISCDAAFSNMFLMEVTRGCGKGCRFCAAGFVYRPPRAWPIEALESTISNLPPNTSVGLVGLESAGNKELEQLFKRMVAKGLHLAFSSLRADALSEDFIKLMTSSGTKTATIAPEAGSLRLRRAINKHLTDSDIVRAAHLLLEAGIENIKLYFMIGLPTEELSDIEALIGLVEKIRLIALKIGKRRGHLGRIIISVNSFVPKAWTPFQWADVPKQSQFKKIQRIISKDIRQMPNVDLHMETGKRWRTQAVLSRGDRRLAPVLESVALENMGFYPALKKAGLSEDDFLTGYSTDQDLPWEIVGHKVKRDFLISEWEKAHQNIESPFCIPGKCKRCGVCTGR